MNKYVNYINQGNQHHKDIFRIPCGHVGSKLEKTF